MSTAELACSYAALILADEGIEVTVRAHHLPDSVAFRHRRGLEFENAQL